MASTINASTSPAAIVQTADGTGILSLQTGNTTAVTIDASQRVGIGTSTTTDAGLTITTSVSRDAGWNAKLGLQSTGTNNYPTLLFSGCSSASRYGAIVQTASTSGATANQITSSILFVNTSSTAGNITFNTNGNVGTTNDTERMRIDSSGNVGIGTSSPDRKLNVTGAAATETVIKISGSTTAGSYLHTSNTGGNFYIGKDNSAGTAFGTTYCSALYSDGAYPMIFWTNATERMRITSAGLVGIGMTPVNTLDVQGTIRAANNNYIKLGYTGYEASIQYAANGNLEIYPRGGYNTTFGETGIVLVGSTAQKATGTTWSNPSDQRLKDNIRDYTKGTTELMQVRVREWEYNGKGGTTEGTKGLGVVADEVMTVLPDTVETYDAKLNADDEEDTKIKAFDATEITWLLVKTVQEQQALITSLTARITALEGA